jgi:hypothetical protein
VRPVGRPSGCGLRPWGELQQTRNQNLSANVHFENYSWFTFNIARRAIAPLPPPSSLAFILRTSLAQFAYPVSKNGTTSMFFLRESH